MRSERVENRVRFKIGEIEFEAEGSAEIVERERSVFLNALLPAAVDAIVSTRGVEAAQYVEAIDRPAMLVSAENNDAVEIILPTTPQPIDFVRTSLSSYIKDLGVLSDQDFTLIAAYYDEKKNGIQSFTSESVKQYYADARRGKYSNYSDLLQRLAQKGYIMDDPNTEKKVPKPYILTDTGIKYVEAYQPKENGVEKPKPVKARKPRSKPVSTYSSLCADDLNLKKYPEIKSQSTFKKQMLLTLYIVTAEGKGDNFSVTDIQCLMTDILGLPASVDQINGIFTKNKSWFKAEQDSKNKKAYTRKLLQGAKDFVQSIIDGTSE